MADFIFGNGLEGTGESLNTPGYMATNLLQPVFVPQVAPAPTIDLMALTQPIQNIPAPSVTPQRELVGYANAPRELVGYANAPRELVGYANAPAYNYDETAWRQPATRYPNGYDWRSHNQTLAPVWDWLLGLFGF